MKNVEWYDWEGSANKRRYLTPDGAPSQTPQRLTYPGDRSKAAYMEDPAATSIASGALPQKS
jgi:hypothetical protein